MSSLFSVFKVNYLVGKNKINTIYVFYGFTISKSSLELEELFKKDPTNKIFGQIFDAKELENIKINKPIVKFVNQIIHLDDSIGVIKLKIFEAFDAKLPNFSHLALIKANEGKISKRVGGFDIKSLREENIEPMAIINLLSQIGSSHNIKIYQNIKDLAENFNLRKFSKSSTKYNPDEILSLNEKILQQSNFSYISKRLKNSNYDFKITEDFWLKIRSNINHLLEIESWWKICKTKIRYKNNKDDHDFLKKSSELLPNNLKSDNSWDEWINSIKNSSDRKGKNLFMPLRKAITGLDHGPELKYIITLIDREEIINRLCFL